MASNTQYRRKRRYPQPKLDQGVVGDPDYYATSFCNLGVWPGL